MYREELAVLVEAYEAYGGEYGRSESLMKLADELSDTLGLSTKQKSKLSHDRAVAATFLRGADQRLYGALIIKLKNNFSRGLDCG